MVWPSANVSVTGRRFDRENQFGSLTKWHTIRNLTASWPAQHFKKLFQRKEQSTRRCKEEHKQDIPKTTRSAVLVIHKRDHIIPNYSTKRKKTGKSSSINHDHPNKHQHQANTPFGDVHCPGSLLRHSQYSPNLRTSPGRSNLEATSFCHVGCPLRRYGYST